MNFITKQLLDKLNLKFKEEFQRQIKFFKRSDVLITLNASFLDILDNLIPIKLKRNSISQKEIKELIQKNKPLKNIIKYINNELDESFLNNLLLQCIDNSDNLLQNFPEITSASNLLSYIDKNNDIDKKINHIKLEKLENELKVSNKNILDYPFILDHIIEMSKDLLSKSDFPSIFRSLFIQNFIRNIYGLHTITKSYIINDLKSKEKIENILNILKQVDNIITASVFISKIYQQNRSYLQKSSKQTLDEISKDMICDIAPDASDYILIKDNNIPLQIDFECPGDIDEHLVPHEPIEIKIENISCEIPETDIIAPDIKEGVDIATIAVIRNSKKEKMNILVEKGAKLNPQLIFGKIEDKFLYSPINGTVLEIKENELILDNISDPIEDLVSKKLNSLNEKYKRLNDIKLFIKNYHIKSLYPIMLANSIYDPLTLLDITRGITPLFNTAIDNWEFLNENYNEKIQNIAGENNVKSNAQNESLYKIQDSIKAEENIFYKNIKMIKERSLNKSKIIRTNSSEYNIFKYYTYELGAILNSIENPTDLEIEFRTIINKFSQNRYMLESYKKLDIAFKLEDLMKTLEKNITIMNMFNISLEKYNLHKDLNDVKAWLKEIADKNEDLEENEKIEKINFILFLFKFYINIDQITQKYNLPILPIYLYEETVKESNILNAFLSNLEKELLSIPNDIVLIENDIENILYSKNFFQTYSIISYNDLPARLYELSNENNCISKETDPYLNPKSSKGYGDIEYWLKYCSFATLASVTNPISGWSTGLLSPSPIMFPVIYVPIKAINTNYGFIVLGTTICGLWVFPFVLLANLTSKHVTPFGDPTASIINQINVLKKEISEGLKELRKTTVKRMRDDTKIEIDKTDLKIKEYKLILDKIKNNKPKKYSDKIDPLIGVKFNDNFENEYEKWKYENDEVEEKIKNSKVDNWKLTQKYKILNETFKENKSIKGIKSLIDVENLLLEKLDVLVNLLDQVDNILAGLPISLKPNSANFGITLKNIKPIIKISDELDDNINEIPLNLISKQFELKNENIMMPGYKDNLNSKIINFNSYKSALKLGMLSIVKKDPFPKFELLNITNVAWLNFLYNDFVKNGAMSFGFPGNAPLSI